MLLSALALLSLSMVHSTVVFDTMLNGRVIIPAELSKTGLALGRLVQYSTVKGVYWKESR
jgi:hypothetical protein